MRANPEISVEVKFYSKNYEFPHIQKFRLATTKKSVGTKILQKTLFISCTFISYSCLWVCLKFLAAHLKMTDELERRHCLLLCMEVDMSVPIEFKGAAAVISIES